MLKAINNPLFWLAVGILLVWVLAVKSVHTNYIEVPNVKTDSSTNHLSRGLFYQYDSQGQSGVIVR